MPALLDSHSFTSFDGSRRIASGTMADVAIAMRRASDAGAAGPILIFDDETGRSIDLDLRGSEAQIAKRYAAAVVQPEGLSADIAGLRGAEGGGEGANKGAKEGGIERDPADTHEGAQNTQSPRGRGRPKLGVVAREITLLPRHWDWLGAQPGGASVALRKLVDEARHAHADRDRLRDAQQRAYCFMSAMAGDYPGFEEASRALFGADRERFVERISAWPDDVKTHVLRLIDA
jgi:hypothetical protein